MFPPVMDDYSSPLPRRPNTSMNQGGMGGMFGMPPQQPPVKEEDDEESPIWLMFKKRAEREMNQKMQQLTQQSPQDLYQEKIDDIRSSKGSLATHLLSDLFGALSGSSKFVPTQQRLQEQAMKEYALQTARMGQAASMERAQTMQDKLVQMQGQFEARQKQDAEQAAAKIAVAQERNRIAEMMVAARNEKDPLKQQELQARISLLKQQISQGEQAGLSSDHQLFADIVDTLGRVHPDKSPSELRIMANKVMDDQEQWKKNSGRPGSVSESVTTSKRPTWVNGVLMNVESSSRNVRNTPGTRERPQPLSILVDKGYFSGGSPGQPGQEQQMAAQPPAMGQQPAAPPAVGQSPGLFPAPTSTPTPKAVPAPGRTSGNTRNFSANALIAGHDGVFRDAKGNVIRQITDLEKKDFHYARTLLPTMNEQSGLVASEFMSDNLKDWSGPIAGQNVAYTLRSTVPSVFGAPRNQEIAFRSWAEEVKALQLYKWTGAQANEGERDTVRKFANLDPVKDPEVFLKGIIMSGAIMQLNQMRILNPDYAEVHVLQDLSKIAGEMVENMKMVKSGKARYKDGKTYRIDPKTKQELMQKLAEDAKPQNVLNRILRGRGMEPVDFKDLIQLSNTR